MAKKARRGLQFIIQTLRALARDAKVPARVRLEALDRLATIDKIYAVEVAPPSDKETPQQKSIDEILAEWKSKMGGEHAAVIQSSSAASNESRR